jgi:hypothetical protein
MDDSLLVSLRSYRPRSDRDPLEDFITEAFAWTLRSHPSVGDALLADVDSRADKSRVETASNWEEEWNWNTQVSLDRGIADMIVRGGDRAYVFEHKVWSVAKAKQVDSYRRSVQADKIITVLITGAPWNYQGPSKPDVEAPDVHLTWAKVSKILAEESKSLEDSSRVDDFRELLDHEGLGPRECLKEPDIRAVTLYQNVVEDLISLIQEIRAQTESWSFAYELLSDPNGQNEPETRWTRKVPRHGRIALNLYSEFTPNVNFGLIVDSNNIETELVDRELGPDLAVFLHLPCGRLSKDQYREIGTGQPYEKLQKRLNEEAGKEWTVFARRGTESGVNKHHPIVLQQPLARCLRGTSTVEEQCTAVLDVLKEGVRLFLEGGEIAKLREEITRYEEN